RPSCHWPRSIRPRLWPRHTCPGVPLQRRQTRLAGRVPQPDCPVRTATRQHPTVRTQRHVIYGTTRACNVTSSHPVDTSQSSIVQPRLALASRRPSALSATPLTPLASPSNCATVGHLTRPRAGPAVLTAARQQSPVGTQRHAIDRTAVPL